MSNTITKVTVARMIKDRLEKIKDMAHDMNVLIPLEDEEDSDLNELYAEADSLKTFVDDVETSGLSYKINNINIFNIPNNTYLGVISSLVDGLSSYFTVGVKNTSMPLEDLEITIYKRENSERIPILKFQYIIANNGSVMDEPLSFIIVTYIANGFENIFSDIHEHKDIFDLVDFIIISDEVKNVEFNDWQDISDDFKIFGRKIKATVTVQHVNGE